MILNPALNSLMISHRHNHNHRQPSDLGQCFPRQGYAKKFIIPKPLQLLGARCFQWDLHARGFPEQLWLCNCTLRV